MATKVSPATSGGIRNGLKFAGEFSAEWLRINDVSVRVIDDFEIQAPLMLARAKN